MKSTVVGESLSTIYNKSSVTEKTTYVLQETTEWEIYTVASDVGQGVQTFVKVTMYPDISSNMWILPQVHIKMI